MKNRQFLIQSKILVVDDEPVNHKLLNGMLREVGYSAINDVVDPREAFAAYQNYQPDLVILDLNMPEVSGFDILRQIVEHDPDSHAPILVLTSETDSELRIEALRSGASEFLNKPFDFFEGLTRIENLLGMRVMFNQVREQNKQLDEKVSARTKALMQEAQERRKVEEQLVHQARHDVLTGYPNRWLLEDRVNEITGQPASAEFTLMIVAVDQFHEINNTLGYQNGSLLLAMIADRIHDLTKDGSKLHWIERGVDGRVHFAVLEGVRFALLVKTNNEKILGEIASKVIDGIAEPFDFQGMSMDVGVHIGFARYPEHHRQPDKLMQFAHVAVELAERSQDQWFVYDPQIDPYSARRLQLMSDLRKAIDDGQLEMYFQPQLDVRTDCVCGAEALIRWEHPELGFVPPDEFIAIAEQTGVIKPLTRWVIDQVFHRISYFYKKGFALAFSINLSAKNLLEKGLSEYIEERRSYHQIPNDLIVLELTESAMMEDQSLSLKVLNEWRETGMYLSIDDFGTGYSSLSYLKKLPVHEIKIDRSFVMDMINDNEDMVIVDTTIKMAVNLGLEVVAEGVEDEQALNALRKMGCHRVQGYHLARPLPPEDFERWLDETQWTVKRVEAEN